MVWGMDEEACLTLCQLMLITHLYIHRNGVYRSWSEAGFCFCILFLCHKQDFSDIMFQWLLLFQNMIYWLYKFIAHLGKWKIYLTIFLFIAYSFLAGFSEISRKLAQMWNEAPEKEKEVCAVNFWQPFYTLLAIFKFFLQNFKELFKESRTESFETNETSLI